jgi:hypothetical protein
VSTLYEWAVQTFKADASKVATEVDQLRDPTGLVEPQQLVDFARSKRSSELHKCFEWDDKSAAQKHRIEQARNVLRSLRIVVAGSDGIDRKQRVNVHIRKTAKRGYYPIDRVAANPKMAAEVHMKAARDLNAWMERYAELRQRCPSTFRAMEAAVHSLEIEMQAFANAAE